MTPLIYSVEDDQNISYVIQKSLENASYEVKTFHEASSFFAALKVTKPDLILLDIMLPGDEDGLAILKKLKADVQLKEIRVIFLSAKSTELDKVIGLDLGADDYLTKPFGVLELISRVKANLRRKSSEQTFIYRLGNIELNVLERTCRDQNDTLMLTLKEFDLLKTLIEHKPKALSRSELLDFVWGYDFVGETRTIDMHIKSLREKIKNPDLIQTVRGIGYKAVDNEKDNH